MPNNIDITIIKWYQYNYNSKPLLSRTQPELSYETSLNTGQYPGRGKPVMKLCRTIFSVSMSITVVSTS